MTRRRLVVAAATTITVIIVVVGAWVIFGGPGATTATVALGPPRYVDETTTAGVEHTYGGGDTSYIGGGVAVFDCNDDRLPDLYLAGGSKPAAVYRNISRPGAELGFTVVPDAASSRRVMGAYPLDIDGDGQVDLAILRADGAELLRGVGDCRFEPGNERWSFAAAADWTTAFSATWEGSSALPTIALGKYVELDAGGNATYT
ncbi:MAG: VCBS repeat-containing protein, partial [Chloroflexota bacterium]|nr:VCBS repeat-containing protein [Chloroflexota bacterium]